jgi:hypothetical protein
MEEGRGGGRGAKSYDNYYYYYRKASVVQSASEEPVWYRVYQFSRVAGRMEEGRGGGRGAKSYDNGKAYSSINHSMLSGEGGMGGGEEGEVWQPRS